MECHDLAPPSQCLPGFFCPGARAAMPPQFCPPTPDCYMLRLSGEVCHAPQGRFEPTICGNGQYCPLGGTEQIQCARGTFCPQGTYEPTQCSLGAYCPPGSARQVELLPLYLLLTLYAVLLPAMLFVYIRQRRDARRATPTEQDVTINYDPFAELLLPIRDRRIRRWGIMTDNDSPQSTLMASEDDTPNSSSAPSPEQDRLIASLKKAMGNDSIGMAFSFHHLRYIKKGKAIINGITGSIPAGSFVGLMGGSGAGKSTFVNLMMGRIQPTTGAIGINDHYNMKAYSKLIAFVPQDDILLPELTVRENILHSARIRLPSTWTPADIEEHVDALIDCLGLKHVQDSQVGDAENPIISGGQRKRVNIGLELAAAPMAIFADEPTSGLDSSTAASIVQLLRKISDIGITVVAVVHQPREQLFRSFDKSLLMKNGKIVYSGTTEGAQSWFDEQGYDFPDGGNPADILMDIMTGDGEQYYSGHTAHSDIDLVDRWENRPATNVRRTPLSLASELPAQRGASWASQVVCCIWRSFVQQRRMARSLAFEIFMATLAGLLIGLAMNAPQGHFFRGFFHTPFTPLSSAPDYVAAPQYALLSAMAIGFAAAAPAVATLSAEKLFYSREMRAGHSISAYYLGKVVASLPRVVFSSLHFTIGLVLLSTPRAGFKWSFVTMTAYFWAIHGLCSIVAVVFKREHGAMLGAVACLVVGALSGVSPSLAKWHSWHLDVPLKMVSPGVWFAEAVVACELAPQEYLYQIDLAAKVMGFTFDQYAMDVGMVFVVGAGYRAIALVLLLCFA